MKICFVDTMGLCYDGSTLNKRGLGGSESAVILLSKELARLGFEVTVFNDCTSEDTRPGMYEGVLYQSLRDIENPAIDMYYDVMIGSRSVAAFAPAHIKERFKTFSYMPDFTRLQSIKHKVLWMHDTFCDGDDLIEGFLLDGLINEVFVLSDFHLDYVTNCDHGRKRNFEVLKKYMFITRNGIGNMKPDWIDVTQKDPNHFVYNSSFTKGMQPLVEDVWPRVKAAAPDAKLTVIGGFYKFPGGQPDEQEQSWRRMVEEHGKDINFTGIISQQEISKILTTASYMLYPAGFPETYGISALESLAHNVPIITCDFGALEETAMNSACYKIPYAITPNGLFPWINREDQVNRFVDMTLQAYHNKYLHQQKMYACNAVKDICGWNTVALQWKQHLFHKLGEYLPVDEYRQVQEINYKVRKTFGRRFTNPEELQPPCNIQKEIGIITAVYNAENYIEKCILSVAQQNYKWYTMYIVDDASTDNTVSVARRTIDSLPQEIRHNFVLILNDENVGAVANHYKVINEYIGVEDFFMILDGDDWLVNDPNIFHFYNNLYHKGAEFTYGSCWSLVDNIPLVAQEYPPQVKANRAYRDYKFNWNMPYTHLRTFHCKLVRGLKETDLLVDGEWPRAGGDTALFYYLIEAAEPDKVVCIPDIVYVYNDTNPLNDYKVNGDEQTKTSKLITSKTMSKEKSSVIVPIMEEKKEEMIPQQKKRILIAIPCKNDIEADTFKSIYDLIIPEGYEADFQYFYGYAVDQVRNLIADWTVNLYDYLFAVDHDIIFAPDTLVKLLSHDKPIVSGVYRQRMEPPVLEIYDSNYRNVTMDFANHQGLFEIGACGFGCVLVKKEVFTAVGYPQFVYHQALSHANTFSEDLDFCRKARDKGYSVWCDTTILCGHIGLNTFTVQPTVVPMPIVEEPTNPIAAYLQELKNHHRQ